VKTSARCDGSRSSAGGRSLARPDCLHRQTLLAVRIVDRPARLVNRLMPILLFTESTRVRMLGMLQPSGGGWRQFSSTIFEHATVLAFAMRAGDATHAAVDAPGTAPCAALAGATFARVTALTTACRAGRTCSARPARPGRCRTSRTPATASPAPDSTTTSTIRAPPPRRRPSSLPPV
jgi:hypothetical protein